MWIVPAQACKLDCKYVLPQDPSGEAKAQAKAEEEAGGRFGAAVAVAA